MRAKKIHERRIIKTEAINSKASHASAPTKNANLESLRIWRESLRLKISTRKKVSLRLLQILLREEERQNKRMLTYDRKMESGEERNGFNDGELQGFTDTSDGAEGLEVQLQQDLHQSAVRNPLQSHFLFLELFGFYAQLRRKWEGCAVHGCFPYSKIIFF